MTFAFSTKYCKEKANRPNHLFPILTASPRKKPLLNSPSANFKTKNEESFNAVWRLVQQSNSYMYIDDIPGSHIENSLQASNYWANGSLQTAAFTEAKPIHRAPKQAVIHNLIWTRRSVRWPLSGALIAVDAFCCARICQDAEEGNHENCSSIFSPQKQWLPVLRSKTFYEKYLRKSLISNFCWMTIPVAAKSSCGFIVPEQGQADSNFSLPLFQKKNKG